MRFLFTDLFITNNSDPQYMRTFYLWFFEQLIKLQIMSYFWNNYCLL